MHALRTLDVWDTLLRRRCDPDVIKLLTCRHLWLRHHDGLLPSYRDPWRILQERCAVEGELAQASQRGGQDDEYTLAAVLELVLRRVWQPQLRHPQSLIHDLINFELEVEIANTYADSEILEWLVQYPARQTLFLSDFYMTADQIQYVLNYHGLASLVQRGLSSCDVGLNKRSGRLFKHVHEAYGVAPSEHLHIGDNPHADVEVPQRLGVKALHYRPEAESQNRQRLRGMFQDRNLLHTFITKRVLAEMVTAGRSPAPQAAYELGVQIAPLFVGFCLEIAEQALIQNSELIAFFTREGEFFMRLFQELFADDCCAGNRLPPVQLLEVSRLSTFCASLRDISTTEMMRVWTLYSTQSMQGLASTLGLDVALLDPILSRHNLDLLSPIQYPWNDPRVVELFADREFLAMVDHKRQADRKVLIQYLARMGLHAGLQRITIVDIGWRGTIQDNLAHLYSGTHFSGIYLGLSRFLNQQPANVSKRAFGPDLNNAVDFSHLLDVVSPMEMICNSPHGSTIGYQEDPMGVTWATRLSESSENEVFDSFTRHLQDGVVEAARIWAESTEQQGITAAELRPAALAIWDRLIRQSPMAMAEAHSALRHNEQFGVGEFVCQGDTLRLRTILQMPMRAEARKAVVLFVRSRPWRHAIWHRRDLTFYKRLALITLLSAAELIRRPYRQFKRVRRR